MTQLISSGKAMNEAANIIFRALIEAASDGRPCPSNERLGVLARVSTDSAAHALRRLRARGYIAIEKTGNNNSVRTVRIIFTNQVTAPTASLRGDSMMDAAMSTILKSIESAAVEDRPAPTERSLAAETGKSDSAVARLIRKMQKAGLIEVEKLTNYTRRIKVVSSGLWTAVPAPQPRPAREWNPKIEEKRIPVPPPHVAVTDGFLRPITKAMLMARR